jgi:hypothetical protein
MRFDFTVYDDSGRPRAIVEAKRRIGTDGAWAAELRRNWLEHGPLPASDVFKLLGNFESGRRYIQARRSQPG